MIMETSGSYQGQAIPKKTPPMLMSAAKAS